MLAKVKCHRNLARSVGYNEEKVVLNKAVCLLAANFIKDADSTDAPIADEITSCTIKT